MTTIIETVVMTVISFDAEFELSLLWNGVPE